jgi:hypothetical protein
MYVTLDFKENAIESAPSEWNAWQSYSYSGLNTVVEGTETEIVINNASAINDIIGFRVFAVNYDGTLVDPDGKAFYVSLGVEGADWGTVNTVITPVGEAVDGTISANVAKTLTALTGAATYEWTTDVDENEIEGTPAFHVVLKDADGELNLFPYVYKFSGVLLTALLFCLQTYIFNSSLVRTYFINYRTKSALTFSGISIICSFKYVSV